MLVGRLSKGFPPVLNTSELRDAYFKKNPWLLEHRAGQSFCPRAIMLGYDTIQIRQEECSRPHSSSAWCFMEVISCHSACTRLRVHELNVACPPGLPLRTGLNASLECECDNARDIANCERTGNASLLPPPYKIAGTPPYPVRMEFDKLQACKSAPSDPVAASSSPTKGNIIDGGTEGGGQIHERYAQRDREGRRHG